MYIKSRTSLLGYSRGNDLERKFEKLEPIKNMYDLAKLYTSEFFFDESMLIIFPHKHEYMKEEKPYEYQWWEEQLQKILREEQEKDKR